MQAQLLCNIAQHQGFHGLVTILEKAALTLHDGGSHAYQGLVTALQALDEPACFLQVVAHEIIIITLVSALDHAGIQRIDSQFGSDIGVQFDTPYTFDFLDENVRYDVLVMVIDQLSTRAGIEAANQRDGLLQLFFADFEQASQAGEIVRCQQIQMILDNAEGMRPHV